MNLTELKNIGVKQLDVKDDEGTAEVEEVEQVNIKGEQDKEDRWVDLSTLSYTEISDTSVSDGFNYYPIRTALRKKQHLQP